jgi:hypothetical protein
MSVVVRRPSRFPEPSERRDRLATALLFSLLLLGLTVAVPAGAKAQGVTEEQAAAILNELKQICIRDSEEMDSEDSDGGPLRSAFDRDQAAVACATSDKAL